MLLIVVVMVSALENCTDGLRYSTEPCPISNKQHGSLLIRLCTECMLYRKIGLQNLQKSCKIVCRC